MRSLSLLLVVPLLVAMHGAPAHATTVLCYGDSITQGTNIFDASESYPSQLQALRPELAVVNEGLAGDVSDNLSRFRDALARTQPDVVVLLLGTNDPVCDVSWSPACVGASLATPARTVKNLFRMATIARAQRARVLILTPTPAFCLFLSCAENPVSAATMETRQTFTRQVAEQLFRVHARPGVTIANLRDVFTLLTWPTLTKDGLHPTRAGNAVLAQFVSDRIP